MPRSQVAVVEEYDFGAPVVEAQVLQFRAKKGGIMDLRFENCVGDADVVVTVDVSADASAWANTTAANNGQAIVTETVLRRTVRDFTINLRQGLDNYVRVLASGGARANLQVRQDVGLEIVTI